MNCDQIHPHLPEFTAGSLPAYRSAWVAQHLAGCSQCRALARAIAPAPVATAQDSVGQTAERFCASNAQSLAVQRVIPHWYWWLTWGMLAFVVAGLAFVLQGPASRPDRRPPLTPPPTPPPITFSASMQRQQGVSLWLESVVERDGAVLVSARFQGRDLLPPDQPDTWATALDAERRPLAVSVERVLPDSTGITVDLRFRPPLHQREFAIRFGGVSQGLRRLWSLALPNPPSSLEQPATPLLGSPSGVVLMSYGIVGDLLQVRLRTPGYLGTGEAPAIDLRDATGWHFASVRAESSAGVGAHELFLHYPVPKEVRLPLTLVGEVSMHNHLGPWLINARMVK